jgi:hypothetical protein
MESLEGSYTDDYNILMVDDLIRKTLSNESITVLPGLEQSYQKYNEMVKKPQTVIERQNTIDKIQKVEQEIREIREGIKLQRYIDESKLLLHHYRKCRKNIRMISFTLEDTSSQELTPESRERVNIIEKYLDIARKYISISVMRAHTNNVPRCSGCNNILKATMINEYGNSQCAICAVEHQMVIYTKTNVDNEHISGKKTDDSFENLMKAFYAYQGLQDIHIPDIIYCKLDEYFLAHNLPKGEEVRKLPMNRRGRRGNTTPNMIWTALEKIGHTEYNDDCYLIARNYWDWELPNLIQHEQLFKQHYISTQQVFNSMTPEEKGRSSSLGTQYRLWRELEYIGHECYPEDFRIAENEESRRIHDRLWKIMVARAHI